MEQLQLNVTITVATMLEESAEKTKPINSAVSLLG